MKKFVFLGLLSVLMVSGVALAHQSEKQKESSMQGMMQQMMDGEKAGNGMSGMRRMNEMTDRCSAMMGSEKTKSEMQGVEEEES